MLTIILRTYCYIYDSTQVLEEYSISTQKNLVWEKIILFFIKLEGWCLILSPSFFFQLKFNSTMCINDKIFKIYSFGHGFSCSVVVRCITCLPLVNCILNSCAFVSFSIGLFYFTRLKARLAGTNEVFKLVTFPCLTGGIQMFKPVSLAWLGLEAFKYLYQCH